jgi:polysaccharide deacetylase family protein (PEP-CTERM system associated)
MRPWTGINGDSPIHAMTCDVEDYFQVSAFSGLVNRQDWEKFECRIPRNMDRILELFAENDVRATFFTLGWVAQTYPEVIRRVADAGHEIASHGMEHIRVWQQDERTFLEDAGSAKKILEDFSGTPVVGYRAASWSMDERTPWAHDVLEQAGYKYSSSIYPIKHDHFGVPDAPTVPYFAGDGELLEIPASVSEVGGRNLPAAGGGYFRLYPLAFSKWLIDRIQSSGTRPYVFYFHPWEMDPDQPRVAGATAKSRFRHYLNLKRFEPRLASLLQSYRWGRMDEIYLGHGA